MSVSNPREEQQGVYGRVYMDKSGVGWEILVVDP